MRQLTVAVSCLSLVAVVAAQDASPQFDVVSIKKSLALDLNGGGGPLPGGRFRGTNITALALLTLAYGTAADRVVDAPDWTRTDRFNIEARASGDTPPNQLPAMLQAMLRDRFTLRAHTEMRNVPVYALIEARPDRKLGPRLTASSTNCDDPEARRRAGPLPNGAPACGLQSSQGHLVVGGVTLARLAQVLAGPAGRAVVNRTTTAGLFNIELDYAPTAGQPDDDRVPIFTAVQEQLGLKLQSDTAPMQVVVIDHIERPSEN